MASTNGTLERHELDEYIEGTRIADQILSEIDEEYRLSQSRQEKPRRMARIGETIRRTLAPFGGRLAAPAGSVASVAGTVASFANRHPIGRS